MSTSDNDGNANAIAAKCNDLIRRRTTIGNRLLRFKDYLNDINIDHSDNIAQLKLRYDKTAVLWDIYDDIQSEIESLACVVEADSLLDRKRFENTYFSIMAKAREIMISTSPANTSLQNPSNNDTTCEDLNTTVGRTAQIRLPQIELPKFDGTYHRWMCFHDSFTSLIHGNTELSTIQKFQYLKTALMSDAANVIDSIDITADNYAVAWQLLIDRYHNTQLIVRNHIRELFDLESSKRGDPKALRKLLDDVQRHLRSLKALGQPTEHWDALLVHLVSIKLDQHNLYQWEIYCANNIVDASPTFADLTDFLKKRCQASESLDPQFSKSTGRADISERKHKHPQISCSSTVSRCIKCGGFHPLYKCFAFKKLALAQRLRFAISEKLCTQCLLKHATGECNFGPCFICKKQHHHLLHDIDEIKSRGNVITDNHINAKKNVPDRSLVAVSNVSNNQSQVLLSTAIIYILKSDGTKIRCRALLDSGAQSNFITTSLYNKLNLQRDRVDIPICGINQVKLNVQHSVRAKIGSMMNSGLSKLNFLILDTIVGELPTFSIDMSSIRLPTNIKLADPLFGDPGQIQLLLGAEIFYGALLPGQIKLTSGPVLQETYFGWIISGPIYEKSKNRVGTLFTGLSVKSGSGCGDSLDLDNCISRFWDLDQIRNPSVLSPSEKYCEELYASTTRRDSSGRYSVNIPLKNNFMHIGDSYKMALRRFILLENRLRKNPGLAEQYRNFMREYQSLGHMSPVKNGTSNDQCPIFHLPHHAVIKTDSSTTKLRVVFDGSAKTAGGLSLNDVVYTGPNLQRDIFEILMRFRRHRIALVADAEKMYRQINVDPAFRNLQRILWRFNQNDPVQTYALNTVTYGTGSASYLAIKTLKQLAIDEFRDFEHASKIVQNDFYVDDLLSGAESLEDAMVLYRDLNSLMNRGGFTLRKWQSNDAHLMSFMSSTMFENKIISIDRDSNTKTLGLFWKLSDDTFHFEDCLFDIHRVLTKRVVLSQIARLYDPLGLIGPVILAAKLIMQRLWQSKCDWDDVVSTTIANEWKHYKDSMSCLKHIRIPRRLVTIEACGYELHGFCDSSELAYGACVYLRVIGTEQYQTRLIGSKSRVCPLKKISLPRLELCGALLLAGLLEKILASIDLKIDSCFLWTDSMIVLAWLNCESRIFNTFVANRISEIQQLTRVSDWRHVASADNPADHISRGMCANELSSCLQWWNGPIWLSNPVPLPFLDVVGSLDYDSYNLLERRKHIVTGVSVLLDTDILTYYSSFSKLKRIVAYIYRFYGNISGKLNKMGGALSVSEIHGAELSIIKLLQRSEFAREIRCLRKNDIIPVTSKLMCLNPFLDNCDIIRVGGRLKNSLLPYESKHPILLPSGHHITKLIAREYHIINLHAAPQLLLSLIRKKYWPIAGRDLVRRIYRECVNCFRVNPPLCTQLMGDLPVDRVVPARPFSVVGVDYGGPFAIRPMIRAKCGLQVYIVAFVCFTTKALHLELAMDLTTCAFVKAFQRFICRRGSPVTVWSDNATNFVGANNEFKKFLTSVNYNNDVIGHLTHRHNILWKFIPAQSPHMGGLWEAGIKAIKFHFYRVARNVILNYDSFITLIIMIEGLLNNRPLCPLSSNPNDLEVLTPNHFLLGSSAAKIDIDTVAIKHYQQLVNIRNEFWNRWSKEYLHNLQQRPKWKNHRDNNMRIGNLVLMLDDNLPPSKWALGRIIYLHPGRDNQVRVVTLHTKNGEVKRAITRIAVFPEQI